ncbi:MAG TPA: pantoate--beta-alanine ligase [Rhizomicrobium sp.]|jgi:pantoate--beta-alanine ligase|nr:pantoate--beta-alanine ligase [Rhizomicrobium sp.]
MPRIVETVAGLRGALAGRGGNSRIAMVPTMGALHAGHLSLVRQARHRAPTVVVSIFVNPAQFAPHEDFAAYPRTLRADLEKLGDQADIVFTPNAAEMYPPGHATTVSVGGPSAGLETDFRPHFFNGVATVVAKLLIAASPDFALFGEKDYQQLLVVRQLVRDLGLPVEIIGVPSLREADGLAMSSRNAYLGADERKIAGELNIILKAAIAKARAGGDLRAAEASAIEALWAAGFSHVDYVAIRDAETLDHIATLERAARILAAVKVGKTRLIDNMAL